ncbi:putative ABC transport system substrate-binding protein [Rhizobiales bacterium GAS191]|nr:putative ABC transport system substrate-binding protein [Rhizobiales bacterium GAS191]
MPRRSLVPTRLAIIAAMLGALCVATAAAAGEPKKIAIASFGPHGSLEQVISGFKSALVEKGYSEGQSVAYDYSDCQFDPSLIPQVLSKLESGKPDLMLTVTTPMTQGAVKLVRNPALPIVFAPVTDPVAAGLVPDWQHGSARFVGASNMQPMDAVLDFSRKLLGDFKSFGLLYNPGDANDVAGKSIAEAAAKAAGVGFKAVGVDAVSDIPQRVAALQGVDFIYAIPSSLLMPALPAIVANADRMKIPVVSSSPQGAQEHLVLAAVTVSWTKVGHEAGLIAARVLAGEKPADLPNYKPTAADVAVLISGKKLKQWGKPLPAALADCNCVVE